MFRILLIILLALIAWRIFRNLRASFKHNSRKPSPRHGINEPKELVQCKNCGTFVLKSNAIYNGNNYYCSEECRRK